jgi:hypothetical protein
VCFQAKNLFSAFVPGFSITQKSLLLNQNGRHFVKKNTAIRNDGHANLFVLS